MATAKTYDPEFKAKVLARLANESVNRVSKDTKVSGPTIYSWAQKAGMSLDRNRPMKKQTAKKAAKKVAHHSNGNGAPITRDPLAQVERELTAALDSVRKVRAAMATVFGG